MKFDDILYSKFSAPAAIIRFRDGKIKMIAVNDTYLPELKINVEKKRFLAEDYESSFDEENLQVYIAAIRKCIENDEKQTCDTKRKMIDNCCGIDYAYVRSRLVLLESDEDEAYLYEAIRNITNEKKTIDTLADIEHRYVQVHEQINIYNWEYIIATKEMRPCYRCMRDLGLTAVVKDYPETAIEMGIFPPDYADLYREMMRRVDAGEDGLEADIPLTVGRIPFRIKYTIERDENGKPVKAFGSATLISETELGRMKLDNNIIAALAGEYDCLYLADFKKDELRTIIQNDIFSVKPGDKYRDLAAVIVSRLEGIESEQAKLLRDEHALRSVLLKGSDVREFVYKDDESNRWIRVSFHAIEHEEGTVSRMLISASYLDDLRAQRLDDARLIAFQKAELEDRQKLLLKAIDEANKANTAKTVFFSNLSHDIRTPMNAINGFSKLALENIDDREKLEECLSKIVYAGDHLMSLINDILDMSRIESGKMVLSPTPARLKDLFKECADMSRSKMEEKGLNFFMNIGALGDDTVNVDNLRFRQILLNLLSNAYKFTPKGGSVWLEGELIKRDKKLTYEIRVRDTGIGMTKEFKEHIWEAFAREENSLVRETQGTGLGMSIVRNIINLMRGSIDLQTEPGKGSEFIIVMEMEPASISYEEEKKDSAVENAMNRRYDGRTILVVDDTPTNLKLAEYVLQKFGFTVMQTSSGVDAIEIVRRSKPGDIDLVLMDLSMPVMDGLEASRRIRALDNKELAQIPIIAMTANAFASDIKAALDAGMNAHVPKPFRQEELIMKIAANLK